MKISTIFAIALYSSISFASDYVTEAIDIGITASETIDAIDSNFHAEEPQHFHRGLDNECLHAVSVNYGVHPDILFAILYVERGTVGKTNSGNSNQTYDLGIFQINEIHLPELNEMQITREDVMNDGCLSAAVAARHLLKSIQNQPAPTSRLEYLQLLARYHSKTPEHNLTYALKLGEAFDFIYESEIHSLNDIQ